MSTRALRPEVAGDVVDALVRARAPSPSRIERVTRYLFERVGIVDRPARVIVPARDPSTGARTFAMFVVTRVRAPVCIERRVSDPAVPEWHVTAARAAGATC